MKDTFEMEIKPDGTIGMVYQDGIETLADEMGADLVRTCRVSHVEPEGKNWVVRSATDPARALRWKDEDPNSLEVTVSTEGDLAQFSTREEAIQQEIKFIRELRNG